MTSKFIATVLEKYSAHFDFCDYCGFLRVREPYWLNEAYSSAIASTDTGLVQRNKDLARMLASLLYFAMGERGNGCYLDAAGGYGLLTRMMRDYGFNFYWSDKYCSNLVARGFEAGDALGICQAVTAFEVMEHLEDPINFISDVLVYSKSDTFIFSTQLFEGAPPSPDKWWYYSLETGQHIAFFQRRTLLMLAERLQMQLYSFGNFHIFTSRVLSASKVRMFSGRASFLFAPLAKRFLQSKVISDHLEMVRRLSSASGRRK